MKLNTAQKRAQGNPIPRVKITSGVPAILAEYLYYGLLTYANMAVAWGIALPNIGAGVMAGLAAICSYRLRSRDCSFIVPPLCCGCSFLLIQIIIHDESLLHQINRAFVTWLFSVTIVQTLSFRRDFLHRFAFVAFAILLLTLPYINLDYVAGNTGLERAGLDHSIGFANPNDLAAWSGFCAVYFIIRGLASRGAVNRMSAWFVGCVCLFIIALTVSRAPLFACAIAVTVSLRHILKRQFIAVIMLIVLSWIVYALGLTDQALRSYTERGVEDTGRLLIWPLTIERILDSPLVGVGVSDLKTFVPGFTVPITPHNGFLFLALSSGLIPAAFFGFYWIKVAKVAFRSTTDLYLNAPFQIPLLLYAFMIMSQLDTAFMAPWATVVFCTTMSTPVGERHSKVFDNRLRQVRKRQLLMQPQSSYTSARHNSQL